MSGAGSPTFEIDASGLRVAIVHASWHREIMAGLRAGALRAGTAAGVTMEEFEVPGSFELPIVVDACAASGRFDAIVALGVVIKGGTPHFEYVCQAATSGLTRAALDHGIPVGFGLLTCDDEQQARDRAGLDGSREDKGAEALLSAVTTTITLRRVRDSSPGGNT